MIFDALYKERDEAIKRAQIALAAKVAGDKEKAKMYQFCGSKKHFKDLLVSPEEIMQLSDNDFFTMDVNAIGYAFYWYFYFKLKRKDRVLIRHYGMIFEAGRIQGIREERQKRKKRSQQNKKG